MAPMAVLLVVAALAAATHAMILEPIPQRNAADFTYEQFVSEFVNTGTPVVIKGYMKELFDQHTNGNPRQYIRDLCGHYPLRETCEVPDASAEGGVRLEVGDHGVRQLNEDLRGKEWGALFEVDIEAENITTVADLMDEQARRRDAGLPPTQQLYLHDQSIDELCPELLQTTRIPKWFPLDSLLADERSGANPTSCPRPGVFPGLNREEGLARPYTDMNHLDKTVYQWPSLFLGPQNTQSSLHIDSRGTTFWMVMVDGTKWWQIYHRNHSHLLHPNTEESPRFEDEYGDAPEQEVTIYSDFLVDVFKPDYEKFPNLKHAPGWELNITGGDVLYIPPGSPHAVYNVDDTIAYSYNLVEAENVWHHLAVERISFHSDLEEIVEELAEAEEEGDEDKIEAKRERMQESEDEFRNQRWWRWFWSVKAIKPMPTEHSETLGSYLNRHDVLKVMSTPENQAIWNEFDLGDFETFYMGTILGYHDKSASNQEGDDEDDYYDDDEDYSDENAIDTRAEAANEEDPMLTPPKVPERRTVGHDEF